MSVFELLATHEPELALCAPAPLHPGVAFEADGGLGGGGCPACRPPALAAPLHTYTFLDQISTELFGSDVTSFA